MHEVKVDFETCKNSDINAVDFSNSNEKSRLPTKDEVQALSRKLCESEPVYLNTNVISRTQVLDLLNKLYENKYRCLPQSPKKQVPSGSAPGAPHNLKAGKPALKDDDQISDDYDDDFDELEDKKVDGPLKQLDPAPVNLNAAKKPVAAAKGGNDDDDDDNWDLDNDDWGDLDFMDKDDAKAAKGKEEKKDAADKNRMQNLFFGGGKDQVNDLDDIPDISNYPAKNEDKFNQVMSSSKEGGGLLASIGMNKNDLKEGAESALEEDSQEEDPHKKSDLFDTSKDRIGEQRNKQFAQQSDEEDLDLGFNSSKKEKNEGGANRSLNDNAAFEAELAAGMSDDDGPMTEEQQKAIEEQFQMIYDKDAELRKALEKSDVSNFTVLEKYQIIEAYMQGGAAGL